MSEKLTASERRRLVTLVNRKLGREPAVPPLEPLPQLTPEQDKVIVALLKGARDKVPVQTLGGYAGSGKSLVVRALFEKVPDFAVCTLTGKAADVLRRRGVPATTIHSLIYDRWDDEAGGAIRFVRKRGIPFDGILVDESSMVGEGIYDDLLSFDLPVIFVGDHGQLEPINSDFNLMCNPDHRLEHVHRNAGEIARFAEWIRNGHDPARFPCESTNRVEFVDSGAIGDRKIWDVVDQIICGYNNKRVAINGWIRGAKGMGDTALVGGERVICLRNNRRYGVFNGQQGVATDCCWLGDRWCIDFDSYGASFRDIPVHPDQFGQEKTIPFDLEEKDDRIPFDYAYAITCHKSQGDQFNKVMVLEQRCSRWDHKRWAYTAASRAREKVYWARGF
jgi:exodeoxyribonuclease-5